MKAFKIPVCLFILIFCVCLNGFAQTDKETKKWISETLEKSEKTFRVSAAGERDTYFYVKFNACKISVTRAETSTSGILAGSAYNRDGSINPSERMVRYSRYNYSFKLSDIDFDNIKFSPDANRSEILLSIVGDAKLIKAEIDENGIKSVRFQPRFIFRVDKEDGEEITEKLKSLARKCRENK